MDASTRRRRPLGWVFIALVLLTGAGAARFLVGRSRPGPAELSAALLDLHHRWDTNGFRPPMELPAFAKSSRIPVAAAAGPMNAFVHYQEEIFPLRWNRVYDLIRVRPGAPVWELYEIQSFERPSFPWLSSKHLLLTITNSP